MVRTGAPTIADVARVAGVSKGTVSFTLNGRPGVSPATRAHVQEVARELGFTPSAQARALSTSRAGALGLVLARRPEILGADPFFAPFIAGVETVLAPRGQVLVLQVVNEGEAERQGYRTLAAARRVDGVLLTDLRVRDERPALLSELGLPALAVGRQRGRSALPAVAVDDGAGIAEAVAHLVGLGHRRIAHVAGPRRLVHGADRRRAWERALQRAGLPQAPCVEADFTAGGGARAAEALLQEDDLPTAVVFANDTMATAAMSVLAAHGLLVPDDVSVVGFDDTELAGYLHPPLTSVRTDAMGWGRAAAAALLAVVDGDPPSQDTSRAPQLVVRGSTSPPRPGPRPRRAGHRERGREERS